MKPIILGTFHYPIEEEVCTLEITKLKYYDTGWECVARYYPEGDDFNNGEYFKMETLINIDFRGFENAR